MKQFNPNKQYVSFHPEKIEDIERKILKNHSFNEEQINFIHFLDSGVIEAGPGSGKTTTLGAKIALLIKLLKQNRSNKGVCIITHTNAAVQEIEELVQKAGIQKIQHPHFIGTIDSFAIEFILKPYYKNLGVPLIVHNNKSEFRWEDHFKHCHKQDYNFDLRHSVLKAVLRRLNSLDYEISGSNINVIDSDSWSNSWDKLHDYESRFKCSIKRYFQEGNIYLSDAQKLISTIILNKEYNINLLSNRFSFIFIDEYQDQMHDSFLALLKDLNEQKVKIQIIGDNNQHIYFNQPYYKKKSLPFNYYQFNVTNRFSSKIAKPLNRIFNGDLQPADFTKSEKPILYTYDRPDKIPAFMNYYDNNNSSVLVSEHRHARDLKCNTQKVKQNELSIFQNVHKELIDILAERLEIPKSKCLQILRQKYRDIYIKVNGFILNSLYDKNVKDDQKEFLRNLNIILSRENVSNFRGNNSTIKEFIDYLEEVQPNSKQEPSIIPIHTVHAVKGLTFTSICIYIPEGSHLQNAFLHTYELVGEYQEVHKRIAYVAMSRPKRHLIVSLSRKTYDALDPITKDKLKEDFSIHR